MQRLWATAGRSGVGNRVMLPSRVGVQPAAAQPLEKNEFKKVCAENVKDNLWLP